MCMGWWRVLSNEIRGMVLLREVRQSPRCGFSKVYRDMCLLSFPAFVFLP